MLETLHTSTLADWSLPTPPEHLLKVLHLMGSLFDGLTTLLPSSTNIRVHKLSILLIKVFFKPAK